MEEICLHPRFPLILMHGYYCPCMQTAQIRDTIDQRPETKDQRPQPPHSFHYCPTFFLSLTSTWLLRVGASWLPWLSCLCDCDLLVFSALDMRLGLAFLATDEIDIVHTLLPYAQKPSHACHQSSIKVSSHSTRYMPACFNCCLQLQSLFEQSSRRLTGSHSFCLSGQYWL